jgi:hypothetical protein
MGLTLAGIPYRFSEHAHWLAIIDTRLVVPCVGRWTGPVAEEVGLLRFYSCSYSRVELKIANATTSKADIEDASQVDGWFRTGSLEP